jgi:hypothetical protein
MWSDNKSYHNQVAINPFDTVDLFLNYTIRNNTRFDAPAPLPERCHAASRV